jgi:hypothetical protein
MAGDDPSRSSVVYRASGATGRHEPIARWLVVVAVGLAIVVVKPWSLGQTAGDTHPRATAPTAAGPQLSVAGPIAAASSDPRAGVADICLDVGAWLVTSIERDRGRTIRVWRAMLPAPAATGPLDPLIPQMPVRSERVLELGWCAPGEGANAPTQEASVDVWRTEGGAATRIHPVTPTAGDGPSAFGALYLPIGPAATSWDPGTYVFRHRSSDGQERWFSLRVELRAAVRS